LADRTNWTPLYAIDTRDVGNGRVDVRLRNVGGDDYDAIRTFDAHVALYGIDGGAELADWIRAVVRDLYSASAADQQTDSQTRWTEQISG
jgi:hypothetical protein